MQLAKLQEALQVKNPWTSQTSLPVLQLAHWRLSGCAAHLDESLSTLHYADRAKAIAVVATRNEQLTEVGRLRQEVEALRRKLALQSRQRPAPPLAGACVQRAQPL